MGFPPEQEEHSNDSSKQGIRNPLHKDLQVSSQRVPEPEWDEKTEDQEDQELNLTGHLRSVLESI